MNNYRLFVFLAENSDKMSEVSKRLLICLAIVVIILLLAVGYLVKFIKYCLKVQGDYVNETMYSVLEAKMIKDSKTFRKESWRKNRIKFYFDARIPMLILLSLCLLIFFYTLITYNWNKTLSWGFIHKINKDLIIEFSYHTENFFGLNIINEWPKIAKPAIFHFDSFQGWITYIFDLAIIYVFIHFMICTCAYISRNIRTITVSNEYFKKDIDALKQLHEQQKAQQPPIPEPSEELEEYLNKNKKKGEI